MKRKHHDGGDIRPVFVKGWPDMNTSNNGWPDLVESGICEWPPCNTSNKDWPPL